MSSPTPKPREVILTLPITSAILSTVVAILLGSYLGGKFILRAWFFSSLSLTFIVIAALGFHHIVVSHQNQPSNFPRRTFKPFTFSAPEKWPVAVRHLRSQAAFPKEFREPLVPGTKDLSDQVNGLLRLVMRDFVLEWFDQISEDAAFPISVERSVRTAIINLRERLLIAISDPTDTMVRKFLPMFTAHLADFTSAERAVRGSRVLTESEEVDKIVASRYGALRPAGLHPATALSFSDPSLPQQEWLRALMEKVLPLVMPEKETKSRTVLVLVREIVACAVLYPVMNLMKDPDVWNQLIEHIAASAIQDRRKVKKFRDALSKQLDSPSKQTKNNFDRKLKKLVQYNEEETFESLMQICRDCQVLSDVRRLRNDLIILISKVEAHKERLSVENTTNRKNIDSLLKRLEEIKGVLDERIVILSGKSIRRRSTLIKPSSSTRLSDLLLSASGQSYFMEFMDRRGRMRLVQFWLLVNNIKDPLEDADSDPLPQHSTWTQNDIDDLSAILHGYFSDSTLDVDHQPKADLSLFLEDPAKATPEQYQRARKAILITQQTVYQTMEREDWPLFRKTDLWHKYLAADSAPSTPAKAPLATKTASISMTRSHSTGTMPMRQVGISSSRNESASDLRKFLRKAPSSRIPSEESHQSSEDPLSRDENPTLTPQQSEEEVVSAISAALNDIIKSDTKDDIASVHSRESVDLGDRPLPGSNRSSIDIPRGSMDITTSPDDRRVSSDRAMPSESVRERLPIFGDDDDYRPDFAIETLTRGNSAEEGRSGLGINVDVIEELEMVGDDIERLKKEIRLTNNMIGKAELTGSYEELRLLKDSRSSMERELARKEQLRYTYASQGGEHNLMEKITIESSGVGHELGSDFVYYNIIVRQFQADDTVVSSWTVSRRYSEFYELHRCLRRLFPEVKNIAFPKKSNPIGAVLKPTRGGFVEGRMAGLERYIQTLLLVPGVRESPDVRSFLSPQTLGSPPPLDGGSTMSPMESSVESLSNLPVNGTGGSPRKLTTVPEQMTASDKEPKSPAATRSTEYAELTPITIPIFDLMIELFDLHHGNNWPRKALIDAVQRLLGGRIERIVRDQVGKYLVEPYIVQTVKQVQDAVWPEGVLRKSPPARTAKEKAKTKRDAGYKLASIFEESAGNIMGHANARSGAARLGSLCQNTHLNTHFAYTVLDELVATLFPELGHPREHSFNL